jgi:AAA+ superfamily predicted ATPase
VFNIEELDFQCDPFGKLYLPLAEKDLLCATIDPYRNPNFIPSDQTIVLLHGGHGVCKTTAVRYAAEYTRRPLLSVLSAEIAKDYGEAEKTFKQILNQAERWKAVLLMEDVELIFSQISRDVSPKRLQLTLILKALENHRGLVFLTTHAIGVIDGSVRSRITLPIHCRPLDDETKRRILTNFVENYGIEISDEVKTNYFWKDVYTQLNSTQLNPTAGTSRRPLPLH